MKYCKSSPGFYIITATACVPWRTSFILTSTYYFSARQNCWSDVNTGTICSYAAALFHRPSALENKQLNFFDQMWTSNGESNLLTLGYRDIALKGYFGEMVMCLACSFRRWGLLCALPYWNKQACQMDLFASESSFTTVNAFKCS